MNKPSLLSSIGTEPAKGMKDLLPGETALRDLAISRILQTYRSYGFERIETPAIEDIRRLIHGEGGENKNLVFKILKRGDKLELGKSGISEMDVSDLGLRFDLTVPLVRYYCHNKNALPKPFKSIQIGPVWRAERPQKGRYRQFYQCDIDIIGESKVSAEIEILAVAERTFNNLGFSSLKLKVNDRRILSSLADYCGFAADKHDDVFILIDKLDKIGLNGITEQFKGGNFGQAAADKFISILSKYLGSQDRSIAALKDLCPEIPAEVIAGVTETIESVSSLFQNPKSMIEFDLSLVRGMGYYTGQIFEAVLPEFPGGSCGGGGRYDRLIGKMSGEEIPACGFSIGFERVLMILEENPSLIKVSDEAKIACFYDPGVTPVGAVMQAVQELREQGNIISLYETPKKLAAKLDQLSSFGYNGFIKFTPGESIEVKPLQKR